MEFLIFSDSHGRTEGMELALKRQIKHPDGIFFLGDGVRDAERLDIGNALLYDVTGNCDWFSCFCGEGNAPMERSFEMEGHRILMTHGHLFGVKGGVGGATGSRGGGWRGYRAVRSHPSAPSGGLACGYHGGKHGVGASPISL